MSNYVTMKPIEENLNVYLSVPCIVCGTYVRLDSNEELALRNGHCVHSKICEDCKKAILYVRNLMDNNKL